MIAPDKGTVITPGAAVRSPAPDTLPADRSGWRRARVPVALAAAAAVFALIPLGILPILYALPVIGLILAFGAPSDSTPTARPVALSSRNVAIGAVVLIATTVVVFQPQLMFTLASLFGTEQYTLVVTLCAVAALALPLALAESPGRIADLPPQRAVLTRRNPVLSMTILITVATWYGTVGMSFLPLAVLVLALPVLLGVSRVRQARRGRVETGLLRHPLAGVLRPYRLQAVNQLVLCVLLGAVVLPGTYDALRLDLSNGSYLAFLIAYVAGLVVLAGLALVPLRRVRLGGNLLVIAASVFLATQLFMIYRPAVEPVTLASPLAGQWYVGQGGGGELVNYHHVTSTQRDALDILQVVDGRTYAGDRADVRNYHIFGDPLLAPADGVVTSVVNDLPNQPIGSVDHRNHAGNHLIVDIGGGRYVMMGHVQRGTIRVAVGERVRAGQVVALVGNSGNTDQPHVHIQVQNKPSISSSGDDAELIRLFRDLRTYPIRFRDVVLTRDGVSSTPAAADLRRGDTVNAGS